MMTHAPHGPLARRQELAEVGAFLLLIVPSMALSFFAVVQNALSFPLTASATILRDVALVALILVFLSYTRLPVTAVGWVRGRWWREIGWGLALSLPFLVGTQALDAALRSIGLSGPTMSASELLPAPDLSDLIIGIVLVIIVAVAEETIFRGYLILRLGRVLGSRFWAMVVSSIVFSVGHGYEGGAGVLTVFVTGFVLAVVYTWRQSLVAPIVMHFVLDFVAIVVASVLLR